MEDPEELTGQPLAISAIVEAHHGQKVSLYHSHFLCLSISDDLPFKKINISFEKEIKGGFNLSNLAL